MQTQKEDAPSQRPLLAAPRKALLRTTDSLSLWNGTLLPGWTRHESDIFRQALLFFGIGNWQKILESGCLPGKTNAQLNLQLQRLLGQQSTAEFQGLHIDPVVIGAVNAQKQGSHIKRKNGCIVNTGGKMSKEGIKHRIQENKEKYEVPESVWKNIVLPRPLETVASPSRDIQINAKRKELADIQTELEQVKHEISALRQRMAMSQASHASTTTTTTVTIVEETMAELNPIGVDAGDHKKKSTAAAWSRKSPDVQAWPDPYSIATPLIPDTEPSFVSTEPSTEISDANVAASDRETDEDDLIDIEEL